MRKTVLIVLFLFTVISVQAIEPEINIVWPKKGDGVGAVDSSFILGSVTSGSNLTINGESIPVHKDGGFIAFLPISPGDFTFNILAENEGDINYLDWHVAVPEPIQSFDYSQPRILDHTDILKTRVLTNGDRLIVECRGTPDCIVTFTIPGYADSVPMVELPPQIQPYWGEAVFGNGSVPDTMKVRGYYQGYIDIGENSLPDSNRIYLHLRTPQFNDITRKIHRPYFDIKNFDLNSLSLLYLDNTEAIDSSRYYILINPDDYPSLVEFTDSVQIVRFGPRKGYLAIFQPEGIIAQAVGRHDDWLKLKLSESQYGWVNVNSVQFLNPDRPPIESYLRAVRMFSSDDSLVIQFPLALKHPFRIEEEDEKTISIYLFGVNSDTDWIRYDFEDKDIELASWSQPEPGLYRLKLQFHRPIWGYDTYYDGNILKWVFNKAPDNVGRLKNKIIVIDPGHLPGTGAVGPTGLTEAKANLDIALALRKELEKKGALVVMTRDDMSPVELYDRPAIAKSAGADLFISIHNNALPDGVNPFVNNGISTYYYHPHSIELAKTIQTEMLKELKLPDYGLYHGNLAVNRPTQYPAVLVECAFMILPEHEALLKTEKFQKKAAKSIRKGIERFLKEYSKH